MRILVSKMMTTLFHEMKGCNFLCTVIMTERNTLFKGTAGTVAVCNNYVYLSISHTHTNMHTKHLSAECTVLATQALKPFLKQVWVKKITEAASEN